MVDERLRTYRCLSSPVSVSCRASTAALLQEYSPERERCPESSVCGQVSLMTRQNALSCGIAAYDADEAV